MQEDSFKLYKHKLLNGVSFYVMCLPADRQAIDEVLASGENRVD